MSGGLSRREAAMPKCNPLLQIWNKLSPRAQSFYRNFWGTKTGNRFIDSENFKLDLGLYRFEEVDSAHLGMLWRRRFEPQEKDCEHDWVIVDLDPGWKSVKCLKCKAQTIVELDAPEGGEVV